MKRLIPLILLLGLGAWYFLFYQPRHPAFTYAGTVEAEEVDVQAGVPSPLQSLLVQEGDSVTPGQLLAELSCPDIRVAAGLAATDFQRSAKLYAAGSLAASGYDRSRFAERDARVKLAWCRVEAPIAGTVLTVYRRAGEWARPGQAILTLADLKSVYAYFYVPQAMLARLRLGQEIPCSLPELKGRRLKGSLAFIRPEAEFTPKNVQTREERERLIYGVKVRFDNPEGLLKPGMSLEAQFPQAEK